MAEKISHNIDTGEARRKIEETRTDTIEPSRDSESLELDQTVIDGKLVLDPLVHNQYTDFVMYKQLSLLKERSFFMLSIVESPY
jgi:hypothetical protein